MLQHYSILGCLREQVEDLGAACKEEVFKRQMEAANDWRTDKELKEACDVGLSPSHMSFTCLMTGAQRPTGCLTPVKEHFLSWRSCFDRQGIQGLIAAGAELFMVPGRRTL